MSSRTERRPRAVVLAVATAAGLVVTGCSGSPADRQAGPDPRESDPARSSAQEIPPTADTEPGMVVPGYETGQFPDVPLFTLPDLSLLYARDDAFTQQFAAVGDSYPGLTLSPVACDDSGSRIVSGGATLAYGDGGTTYAGPDGITHNFGNGAGLVLSAGEVIQVNADGSGSYVGPSAIIEARSDGSGQYTGSGGDAGLVVSLNGRGAGTYTGRDGIITNDGDGSGNYSGSGVVITNNGDGSGSYVADRLLIENDGKGTAHVVGSQVMDVAAPPLAPVPALGQFPPLGALKPQTFCGVSITVDSTLLFDFGRAEIRPDAQAVVGTVAQALRDHQVPKAVIEGHTDSISDEAFNQTLSENRAGAVRDALVAAGVTSSLEAVGYGKTRPVAPNEIDGQDNPAGRQLNRRVEIYIPTFP